MSNETIAWKICYTDNGQYRTVLSKHNSVGDYRAIDPMASSIALCAAPVSAEPTDDEIIDMAVEPLGIDCDRMPYGVIVFARTLLSRYSAAPVAAQAQQYASGGNLADRLDGLADTASPGSQMQSDLYAAATIWRKHLKGPAAQQPVSGADGLPHAMLPARPEPEASNTFGLGLDGYTGAQMLTYGRACAEAQRKADSQAKLSGNTGQLDHLPDATKMVELSGISGELPIELRGITETLRDGDGAWRPCSGCHELNEGHDTGPFSKVLGCALGGGCSECGGIGAVWDTTDYAAMGDFMAAKDQQDADKVDAELLQFMLDENCYVENTSLCGDDHWRIHWPHLGEYQSEYHPTAKAAIRAAIDAARKEPDQ